MNLTSNPIGSYQWDVIRFKHLESECCWSVRNMAGIRRFHRNSDQIQSDPIAGMIPLGRCILTDENLYKYSTVLQDNVADLWWTVDDAEREITFELHVKTMGWISLGISPAGGMKGADIGVGWVDSIGNVHFQDRYASDFAKPVIDNTTTDWFAIRGREQNGWTAIQFKRLLDTCDSMDYPIKSGTNVVIFAYGLADLDPYRPDSDISYHDNRRGSRIVPLRSYGQPPPEDKFAGLDFFDFRLNNYSVPSNDTTYHCQVYKAPINYKMKRHAIAHKILVDSDNQDLVHHLLLHECSPSAIFDDKNLPSGVCDEIVIPIESCSTNFVTVWAIGGDSVVEYTEEAGYSVGGDSSTKYYMIQMHYENSRQLSNRRDSSGIRFYLSNQLRQHDLGYLTFGTVSNFLGLAIPPLVEQFLVDSYCPAKATHNFPQSGITVLSAMPHTHLQGRSMWTKLIRNKTAVQYLFNAESYDFNYQYVNRLAKPIKLYPGDAFATRCVYNTMNKDTITLGGERTKDEMCLHFFTYYPRIDNFSGCFTMNTIEWWQKMMNSTSEFDYQQTKQWLLDLKWTPEFAAQWQRSYDDAPLHSVFARNGQFEDENLGQPSKYEDLKSAECIK
ncbi:unnamed protein product [Rotaria magnacalcarata]|uniref:DOMON domain-containing protein n=2 Tax=Rotaria magnacalcarata TaxID=392030 RepID=A0A815BQR2_9BILA|nr:unnamed protein product [Rotaria magnacalcarata]CAF3989689.1 unnamed protein product [Rotaria magnacalcarata]CAF4022980.1 unnamed protein product [Rotaria magnacalcarata]